MEPGLTFGIFLAVTTSASRFFLRVGVRVAVEVTKSEAHQFFQDILFLFRVPVPLWSAVSLDLYVEVAAQQAALMGVTLVVDVLPQVVQPCHPSFDRLFRREGLRAIRGIDRIVAARRYARTAIEVRLHIRRTTTSRCSCRRPAPSCRRSSPASGACPSARRRSCRTSG